MGENPAGSIVQMSNLLSARPGHLLLQQDSAQPAICIPLMAQRGACTKCRNDLKSGHFPMAKINPEDDNYCGLISIEYDRHACRFESCGCWRAPASLAERECRLLQPTGESRSYAAKYGG